MKILVSILGLIMMFIAVPFITITVISTFSKIDKLEEKSKELDIRIENLKKEIEELID